MISWNAYLIDRVGDSLSATRVAPWKNGDFHFPGRINKQAKYWKFPDEKSLAARFLSSTRELWWNIPINGSPSRAKGGQGNWCTKVCSKTATCGNYTHTHAHVQTSTEFSLVNGSELCAIVSTLWIASNFVVKSALRKGKVIPCLDSGYLVPFFGTIIGPFYVIYFLANHFLIFRRDISLLFYLFWKLFHKKMLRHEIWCLMI